MVLARAGKKSRLMHATRGIPCMRDPSILLDPVTRLIAESINEWNVLSRDNPNYRWIVANIVVIINKI